MTIGWRTLDVGEKALIYSKDGTSRIEEGPQQIFLFREKYIEMKSYSASQKQYIVIKYKDGRVEHCRGPCTIHYNEVIHSNIEVEDMFSLSANEALVVYTQDPKMSTVQRNVHFGPTLFMLNENEWIHEFSWHGTDPMNKTRLVADIQQFRVLKVIPDQFYYNVDEVRTADDALLRVKLMMFYELTDVEKMLNTTKDPMADFSNCLCADVIAFAANKSYEDFIESASELNNLKNFAQLTDRCAAIGYSVSKVAFRGYFAHEKLQGMHDVMIKKRTELQMAYEKEEQTQLMLDQQLESDMERMEQEQQLELENLIHQQDLEMKRLSHQLDLEKTAKLQTIEKKKQEEGARLAVQKSKDSLKEDHLKNLHSLGVNINDVLVAQSGHPLKLTKIVATSGSAAVHIHHNDQNYVTSGSTVSM